MFHVAFIEQAYLKLSTRNEYVSAAIGEAIKLYLAFYEKTNDVLTLSLIREC
jgi:hypothetical protein